VGNTEEPCSVLSFCTGYAGIERGLTLAGVNHRTLAYVEIEAFAIANLVSKMESDQLAPTPIWTNVKTFPAHLFRGKVDILDAGYPCQPFSVAGQNKGKEYYKDPRHLWPYIRDHIETIRPVRCFFENVEGHINRGLREVIGDLEELGYTTTWGLFSAEEVGAPHQRKRVFIMAHTNHRCDELQKARQKKRLPGFVEGRLSPEWVESLMGLPVGWTKLQNDRCDSRGWKEEASWLDGSWEKDIPRVAESQEHCTDRLILLGNGVVPSTAAKAWTVLDKRFKGD